MLNSPLLQNTSESADPWGAGGDLPVFLKNSHLLLAVRTQFLNIDVGFLFTPKYEKKKIYHYKEIRIVESSLKMLCENDIYSEPWNSSRKSKQSLKKS